MRKLTSSLIEREKVLAFWGAACLFLSTLEYLFPKPLPFFRLGLANLPILICLDYMRFRDLFILSLLKILGQALVGGTLLSNVFLFSAAGSLASLLVMFAAHKSLGRWLSLTGTSLLGAIASNAVQLMLSVAFIYGPSSLVFMPALFTVGTVSGAGIGIAASAFLEKTRFHSTLEQLYLEGMSGGETA